MARRNNDNLQDNGLHGFEGRHVIGTKVAITHAGDGLSEAMSIDPEELPLGAVVYVVLECETTRVAYEPVKDTGTLIRKHTLRAGTATLIEKDSVGQLLEDQRVKIERAKGVERLDFGLNPDDTDATDPANAAEIATEPDGQPL